MIVATCCCGENGGRPQVERSLTSRYSEHILEALDELLDRYLITDPAIPGHPVVYVSPPLLAMSGYSASDIVGRNARILQGPATDRRTVSAIREAVREERSLQVNILNYRCDGTPYWVLFHMEPIFAAADGRLLHFLGVQVPIISRPAVARAGIPAQSCRNELQLGNYAAHEMFLGMVKGELHSKAACVASDWEKEKALTATSNILSVLNCYSKLTGLSVSTKRCCPMGIPALSSSLNLYLGRIKQSFVLTDPKLPDMPIVYASDSFLQLTGYSRHEVLGRNCRFLYGADTSSDSLQEINNCLYSQRAITACMLSCKKDGSPFHDQVHVSPLRDSTGKVAFHIWVHLDKDTKSDFHGLSPEMWQLGAVGAARVAIRSLSASTSVSRPPR